MKEQNNKGMKKNCLTLIRISLFCGGATSISSITRGVLGSQATAARHLITYKHTYIQFVV